MTNVESMTPTDADFQAAAEKLQSFLQGLSGGEQAAVRSLLQQAIARGSDSDDVSGYDYTRGGGTEYQVMVDGVLEWVFPSATDIGPSWQPVNSPHYPHNTDL